MVTGASRGIGAACSAALAGAGAQVIAVARTKSELQRLRDAHGDRIEIWPEDIHESPFRRRLEQLPRLDVLVNNAGTNTPQPFLEVEERVLDEMIALNVRAAFLTAQSAVRVMLRSGDGGSIINISSQMGHVGSPRRTAYCMTKHAVEGLTKAMGVELAPLGIRVNSVAPTFIETPMTVPMLEDEEFKEWVLERIPMGRVGRLEEVVAAVMFLASAEASLVTASSLKVDGGWTAW